MRPDELKSAAQDFSAAALLGFGWEEAVERLADAAEVTGAALECYHSTDLKAGLPSSGLVEMKDRFEAGESPFCSRLTRVKLNLDGGFRLDQDDYDDEGIARDPYYQEFAAPLGAFWNAIARLAADPGHWHVELCFKRPLEAGPYSPAERATLDALLPELRAATRIARCAFDVESAALARPLHQRGDRAFELDAWGRVRRTYADFDASPETPVRVVRGRLVAADERAQEGLDRAIALAIGPPHRAALAPLPGVGDGRHFLQCVPVVGRARDVFLATAAIAVVIDARRPPSRSSIPPLLLVDAFDLTAREAEVAVALTDGLDVVEIAQRLGLEPSTVRSHLKSVFEKAGVTRQAELVALIARLRP